jgi:probable rRNA maturation factor
MGINVEFTYYSFGLPQEADVRQWVGAVLPVGRVDAEIGVRIVDEAEAQSLNQQFRGKDYVPNVLSFPADLPRGMDLDVLGDIALCAPVAIAEARAQHKAVPQHFAHLLIHGTLHLLGFDHESEDDAETMEQAERELLATFGFPDPYLVTVDADDCAPPSKSP